MHKCCTCELTDATVKVLNFGQLNEGARIDFSPAFDFFLLPVTSYIM